MKATSRSCNSAPQLYVRMRPGGRIGNYAPIPNSPLDPAGDPDAKALLLFLHADQRADARDPGGLPLHHDLTERSRNGGP